jgi:hypothetical protein
MSNRCDSGNLKIRLALAATNDLDYGGCRFRGGTGFRIWVVLGKELKQLGFNFFSFVLVHQFFFLFSSWFFLWVDRLNFTPLQRLTAGPSGKGYMKRQATRKIVCNPPAVQGFMSALIGFREANIALRRGQRITCQQQVHCVGTLFISDRSSWQALNDHIPFFFRPGNRPVSRDRNPPAPG